MSRETRELANLAELMAIEAAWRDLWRRDPRATPFQSPDWLLPWTRHLWGGGRIRALSFWEEGRLRALAPFFEWGMGSRYLSFLGSGITDYLDIVAEPDFAEEAARQTFNWIEKECAHCETIDLQELAPGSPLLAGVRSLWREVDCAVCPVVALPKSFEELLAGLDPKLRTDVRRAENRLAREASVEIRRGFALLDELFRLHAERWRERNEEGMLSTIALEAFHREAAQRFLEAGALQLFGLFANGHCIAVQYNLSAKGRTFAYLSGFDPQWSRFSPGAVLLGYSIRQAIEEGAVEFDFLRRPEPFKYLWGAGDRVNRRLVLARAAPLESRAEMA